MKYRALLGSAVAALGVATTSLLAPQSASALDFSFSFGGVQGLISGLVDGINACQDLAGPCFVTVTDAAATGAPTGNYFGVPGFSGPGFTVAGGAITAADFIGSQTGAGAGAALTLCQPDGCSFTGVLGGDLDAFAPGNPGTPIVFAPVQGAASVPSPLPLFGAAAAFGTSRQLRKRIKARRPLVLALRS